MAEVKTSDQAKSALHALDADTAGFAQAWSKLGAQRESLIVEKGGPLVVKVLDSLKENGQTEKASQDLLMLDHFRENGLVDEKVTAGTLRGWALATTTWRRLSKETADAYKPFRQAYALRDAASLPDEEPEDGSTRTLEETVKELIRKATADVKERSQKAQSTTVREYGKKLPPKAPKATADSLKKSEQIALVHAYFEADGKRTADLLAWCESIPVETVAAIVAFGAAAHNAVKPVLGPVPFADAVVEAVETATTPDGEKVDEDGDGLIVKVDPAAVLAS